MKSISKTKIEKQMQRKTNKQLRELIIKLKKQSGQGVEIARELARPSYCVFNLSELNSLTEPGETVIVSGKVLGCGELAHKLDLAAFGFSESAREKIKKAGGKIFEIQELIGKKVRILKK